MRRRKIGHKASRILSISVSETYEYVLDLLTSAAQREGISRSEFVMKVLAEYFSEKKMGIRELKERLQKAVDMLDSYLTRYESQGIIPQDIEKWIEEAKTIKEAIEEREDWLKMVRESREDNTYYASLKYLISEWEEILQKNGS